MTNEELVHTIKSMFRNIKQLEEELAQEKARIPVVRVSTSVFEGVAETNVYVAQITRIIIDDADADMLDFSSSFYIESKDIYEVSTLDKMSESWCVDWDAKFN